MAFVYKQMTVLVVRIHSIRQQQRCFNIIFSNLSHFILYHIPQLA